MSSQNSDYIERRPHTIYGYLVAFLYFFWYIFKFFESLFYLAKGEKNPIIIVPVRDRDEHLRALLEHLQDKYTVLIVEQSEIGLFNRGGLINAGVGYLEKIEVPYTHIFIHDVDMISRGYPYYCFSRPTIISSLLSRNYFLTHPYRLSGGVMCISRSDFLGVNGFSNNYEGWGCEDNDFLRRLKRNKKSVNYFPGIFRELYHKSSAKKSLYEKNRNYYNNDTDSSGYNNTKLQVCDNGIHKKNNIHHIIVSL